MRRLATVATALLLLGIVVAAVAIPLVVSRTNRELAARRAAIRAQGLPADLVELDAWYPWPATTAENGAAYVEVAFAQDVRGIYASREGLPFEHQSDPLPVNGPLPLSTEEAIVAELDGRSQVLSVYRMGGLKKTSRYSIDLTQGCTVPLEHLSMVRHAARLLALEALLQIEHRQRDAAVEGVEAIVGLGETLAEEPLAVSQLTRMDIQVIYALPVLARLLSRGQLADAQLAHLTDALHAAETRDCFYRGPVGERCLGDGVYGDSMRVTRYLKVSQTLVNTLRQLGLLTRDRLRYMDLMEGLIEATRAPVEERFDRVQQAREAVGERPWYAVVSSQLLWMTGSPGGPEYLTASVRHAACLRCARTALAIERYRLAHGAPPERLEELVPAFLEAVPVDPFTRAPLAYKRDGAGYVIYSVGADRRDDGGAVSQSGVQMLRGPSQWDHPFRVEHDTGDHAA